jgi:hypothetical protein
VVTRNGLRGDPPGAGIIRGVDEDGNGPQGPSEAFAELMSVLRDPHRHETAAMWERVAQSEEGAHGHPGTGSMSHIISPQTAS